MSAQQRDHVVTSFEELKMGLAFLYATIRDGFVGQIETELPWSPLTAHFVRIRCKESICSVCQYDSISYSVFSREAVSP